jgi:DNA repair photolyase
MISNPIYKPKGAAKEYGELAINIYTGCPHRCYYCFAPSVLRKDRELFHSHVEPREGIVEAVRKQLAIGEIKDKLIHLCFTCDPYPTGHDSTATREIIKLIKDTGNHVQILTKGDGTRDFDLLDENDWYGVSISCNADIQKGAEPKALNPLSRLLTLGSAKQLRIKTWVSFEPVLDPDAVLSCIAGYFDLFDKIKIGKLNYHILPIDWKSFGETVESVCQETGVEYCIKESLRKKMEE